MLTYQFEWPHDLPGAPTRAETVESQSLQVPRHLHLQCNSEGCEIPFGKTVGNDNRACLTQ
eukprot:2215480-Pyramimonas_sp.AAC.1